MRKMKKNKVIKKVLLSLLFVAILLLMISVWGAIDIYLPIEELSDNPEAGGNTKTGKRIYLWSLLSVFGIAEVLILRQLLKGILK